MMRSLQWLPLVCGGLLVACGDDTGSASASAGEGSSAGPTTGSSAEAGSTSGTSVSTADEGPTTGGSDDGTSAATTDTTGSDSGTSSAGGTDTATGTDTGTNVGPVCDVDVVCTKDTVWSRQFGNSDDTSSNESIWAVAVDDDGFSLIAGPVTGSVDFGPHGVIEGPYAAFVAKVDPDGEVVWVNELQAETAIDVDGIDLDDAQNATLVGNVRGDLDAGAGLIPGDGASWDGYLASFDVDGDLRFADVYGSYADMDIFRDVAVHPDGTIAVTGYFEGNINFGGSQLQATSGSDDVLVAVFDQDGSHIWSRRYGDASTQQGDAVTFDGDANVIVAVRNYDTIDFGGMPHTSDGGFALAMAKLDGASGERIWSRHFDDTINVAAGIPRIEADEDAIYLGTYSSSASLHNVDFGMGGEDAFFYVVKFDQGGQTQWSRGFDALRGVQAIEPDLGGSVVVVGDLQGTADFGGVELTSFMSSYDAFMAKYDATTGDLHWARRVGDYNQQAHIQRAAGVGVDTQGFVYVGGSFSGAINFGDGQLVASNGFGGSDGFLAKLEP